MVQRGISTKGDDNGLIRDKVCLGSKPVAPNGHVVCVRSARRVKDNDDPVQILEDRRPARLIRLGQDVYVDEDRRLCGRT